MRGKARAFGLVLAVALVIGAIGAQGAAAVVEHSFRSSADETVITGNSETSHIFRAGTGGPSTTCTVATFSGTNVGQVRDTITLHPTYSSCTAFGANATIHTDGCNYILDSDTTSGGHFAGEHATMSIECEKDGVSTPTHAIKKTGPGCTVTFSDTSPHGTKVNQSLHGLQYTNVTHSSTSSLTVNATVGSIHYVANDSGGIACNLAGIGDGTKTNGITEGKYTLTGYVDPGSGATTSTTTVGTTWHHTTQVNISISTPT